MLDCSPVPQGLVTADTSLVLTDCGELADPPGQAPPSRAPAPCVSDFAHYSEGLGNGRSLLDSRKLLGSGFSGVLQALECRLEVRVVGAWRWAGPAADVDSCVFVSKQLLIRLGLFNQEWVKVWRPGVPSRERLVLVQVLDPTASPEPQNHQEDAFISGTLWFNMTGGDQRPERSCTLGMKVTHTDIFKGLACHTASLPVGLIIDFLYALRGGRHPLQQAPVVDQTASAARCLRRLPASSTSSLFCLRSTAA